MDTQAHPTTLAPHRGTLILVLGILSIVLFQPLGFAPWIMGNHDLQAMDAGRMDPEGRSLTDAGRVCGIVGLLLLAIPLALLVVVGFAILFIGIASA